MYEWCGENCKYDHFFIWVSCEKLSIMHDVVLFSGVTVRQGKFEIDYSWEWKAGFITLFKIKITHSIQENRVFSNG